MAQNVIMIKGDDRIVSKNRIEKLFKKKVEDNNTINEPNVEYGVGVPELKELLEMPLWYLQETYQLEIKSSGIYIRGKLSYEWVDDISENDEEYSDFNYGPEYHLII